MIDSGSTHNFINKKLATRLNCFIYPAPEFQVLIADGGTVSCSGKCHSIKLSMGDYQLDTPMYAISMGAADIVLGVQWLTTLGTIEMNFQELFMRFQSQGKVVELRGLKAKFPQLVSSHQMQKLLKKGANGFVAQLCSLEVSQSRALTHPDLQEIIDHHSVIFDIPKGLPPKRDHEHAIQLVPGSQPPNIRPYRYPHIQKSEIEKIVEEMLEAGIIRHSQSAYSSPVVLVRKKDETWRMCPDYRVLN